MKQRVFATALVAALLSACGEGSGINEPHVPAKLTAVAAIGTDPTTGASIETDLDDYAPGGVVTLVGRGWAPNETVHLVMTEEPDMHGDVVRDVQTHEDGTFSVHFYDVQESDIGVRFTLTGTGATSGSHVTVQFTDGRNINAIVPSPASPAAGTTVTTALTVILNNGSGPQNWNGTKWEIRNSSNVVIASSPAPCIDTPNHTFQDADETNGNKHQGSFTFVAPAAGTYTLSVSVYSTDNCSVASDATTQAVTFTTTGSANTPPVLDAIGNQTIDELSQLAIHANATDDGLPNGSLTFSLANPASGNFPTGATITSNGVFSWIPTEAQGPGTYRVKVVVSDGALTDEEEIEITVNEVQSNPVLDHIGDQIIDELQQLAFTATASDPDGGSLTLSLANPGSGNYPTGASITAGGAFTWTPTEAQGPGVYRVKVVVSDADNNKAEEEIQITVNEVNVPPVLNSIGNRNVDELVPLSFTATASDTDLPAQTLSFSLANPASGTFPTGATISPAGAFAWTPTEAQGPGTYRVKVVVSDGVATDEEEIEITVNEVNVAPVLTVPANFATQWGAVIASLTATATDADIPANTLTFSKVSGPTWVTVATDGTISFGSTTAADVGVHTVRVRVEDNGSPVMGDEKQFQITVQNRPTRLVYDGKTSGQYSDESTLSATLKDDGVAPLGGTALVNKTVDFYYNNVKVGSGTTDVNGKASYDYVIPSAAGSNTVEARYAGDGGYDASTSGSSSFNVNRENAEGLSVSNAGAAQVGVKSFTVSVGVKEARLGNGNEPDPNDGQFPGSIANVPSLTAMASPVSGGSNIAGTCTAGSVSGSGYGAVKSFSCKFGDDVNQLPVDVYTLTFTVVSDYYTGGYEDVFSIWDPGAGFATGGGSFMFDGDRVSFGFSFTMTKGKTTPRGGLVVVRHLAGGGVCRAKSNSMDAPAVVNNIVTLGGKGNYNCVVNNVTTMSQGNINLIAVGEDWATSGANADKFRVKAMDKLDMAATVVLAGGNIQVPQPGTK